MVKHKIKKLKTKDKDRYLLYCKIHDDWAIILHSGFPPYRISWHCPFCKEDIY